MNKKTKKKVIIASMLTLLGIGVGASLSNGNDLHYVFAADCTHEGNHYTELSPTETEGGTHEYWVCCICHEHYLTQPSVGTWEDAGVASHVSESDDRYIDCLDVYLEGFEYTVDENGDITITGYTGTSPNVVIPEGVTKIASGAFSNITLDTVVLPSSIQVVENNAFKDSGAVSTWAGQQGDDFVIYVNMTEEEFKALHNGQDWNAAYNKSALGWNVLPTTVYATVVYLPNWHYNDNGIPVRN